MTSNIIKGASHNPVRHMSNNPSNATYTPPLIISCISWNAGLTKHLGSRTGLLLTVSAYHPNAWYHHQAVCGGDQYAVSRHRGGGRRSPAVACWAFDH